MREDALNLGKGEVVSSILTGSTMKIPPLFWSSERLHLPKGSALARSTEHARPFKEKEHVASLV
jgi:hypothetical protein